MRLVVLPVSFVLVACDVPESSFSVCFVKTPVSGVLSSVSPCLLTVAVPHIALPLTNIPCSVFKYVFLAVFYATHIVVVERTALY